MIHVIYIALIIAAFLGGSAFTAFVISDNSDGWS